MPPSGPPKSQNISYDDPDRTVDEERKGLLSNDFDNDLESESGVRAASGWSRRTIIWTAIIFIILLVSGVFARRLLVGPPPNARPSFSGSALRSNGTHEFKRTVLIVSIDGLRADYLDRGLTPHLLDISKQGLRAKSMKPIFPTLTFPNHWALMTGLHAESHGIVANNFWDPVTKVEFQYNRIASCWNPTWWWGEPMWETAGKSGMITANLMWPGPPKTSSGATSTYFVPWKDKVPLSEKLDQITKWIDLPLDSRPQLIMAYEPSLDQAGHATGPMSTRTNETLIQVDTFAKELYVSLKARNLTDIVDIVFVSDHGMVDTTHLDWLYLDDILGAEGLKMLEHVDGYPAMGLRFNPASNVSHYLDALLQASDLNPEKFDVYTHETMPERYHFSRSERIAPIYVVPRIGYALTTRAEGDNGMNKGSHGYDNDDLSMHAMFVAHGPFSSVVKTLHQGRSQSLSARFLPQSNKGWHSTSDDTYIMERFPNVEIYGLVMKLLGIEDRAASTNGTVGFWDKYF